LLTGFLTISLKEGTSKSMLFGNIDLNFLISILEMISGESNPVGIKRASLSVVFDWWQKSQLNILERIY
jgi:hypothetical protein